LLNEKQEIMNTYTKYCPNVYVAKCIEQHEKGEVVVLTTKYGQKHECEVWNPLGITRDGFWLYSITRCDGMNSQERAKRRMERLQGAALNAQKRSDEWYQKSNEGRDFLSLAEPIKIGHHSEKRHRALIERNHRRMENCMAEMKVAESYESRVEYWAEKMNKIDLSMPESVEYFEFELERAKMQHEGLKNGTIERAHSFSLTYAKKEVNEIGKKLEIAKKLWS
jgi:hypothetical protein